MYACMHSALAAQAVPATMYMHAALTLAGLQHITFDAYNHEGKGEEAEEAHSR